MRYPTGPNPGFIVITDSYGSVVETHSENSVIDEVLRRCEVLDRESPDDGPHSAWSWELGGFSRVMDRIHK